jgi:hypothetical protein
MADHSMPSHELLEGQPHTYSSGGNSLRISETQPRELKLHSSLDHHQGTWQEECREIVYREAREELPGFRENEYNLTESRDLKY